MAVYYLYLQTNFHVKWHSTYTHGDKTTIMSLIKIRVYRKGDNEIHLLICKTWDGHMPCSDIRCLFHSVHLRATCNSIPRTKPMYTCHVSQYIV